MIERPDLNVVYDNPFAIDAAMFKLLWLKREYEAKPLKERLALARKVRTAREAQ